MLMDAREGVYKLTQGVKSRRLEAVFCIGYSIETSIDYSELIWRKGFYRHKHTLLKHYARVLPIKSCLIVFSTIRGICWLYRTGC